MYFNQSNEDIAEDENKCHICDIEFEQLELHFLTSHTSPTILDDVNKEDEDICENKNNEAIIETDSKEKFKCDNCSKEFGKNES